MVYHPPQVLRLTTCGSRFTETAEEVITKLNKLAATTEDPQERRVSKHDACIIFFFLHFLKLYMRHLRKVSVITACDFFTVDRGLVTSFHATTFIYGVILIQSTNF